MNILTDPLPDTLRINDAEFGICTDFREWIKVGAILSDFKDDSQYQDVLERIFDLVVTDVIESALGDDFLDGILQFYTGPDRGKKSEKEAAAIGQAQKRPDWDFELDAEYIVQSFAELYGIRLTEVDHLHWWEFLALFYGTLYSEHTSMNMVVCARQAKVTTKMPKEERARITKMKKIFALPLPEEEKEMNSKVAAALTKMARPTAEEEGSDGE